MVGVGLSGAASTRPPPTCPCTRQVTAGVILLSMIGVNVSALLLPAGVMAAVAAKDLSHNFLAGFFLMMVQPFRRGLAG